MIESSHFAEIEELRAARRERRRVTASRPGAAAVWRRRPRSPPAESRGRRRLVGRTPGDRRSAPVLPAGLCSGGQGVPEIAPRGGAPSLVNPHVPFADGFEGKGQLLTLANRSSDVDKSVHHELTPSGRSQRLFPLI